MVLNGAARNSDKEIDEKYALISEEETVNNFVYKVEFSIDDILIKTMDLPLNFIKRGHELFFKYELEEGEHTLKIKILNPSPKTYIRLDNLITYSKDLK